MSRPTAPRSTFCFLAKHGVMENDEPMPPCDGLLVRVHLIPQQQIKAKLGSVDKFERFDIVWDPAVWVWACGGLTGIGGHHGLFDHSRRLRLSRDVIPQRTELFAEMLELVPWLDREYGERSCTPR
jgi:hypothetical protein